MSFAEKRLARAITAQRAAIDLAAARGDVAEEAARVRSLQNLERRARRTEAWTSETAAAFAEEVRKLDHSDGLRRLIVRGGSGIGLAHLHAAKALRDHISGGGSAGCGELRERVDGGAIHNGQMEGLIDRRRPLRYAINAAIEAVEDRLMIAPAMQIILTGRTPRAACDHCGVTWGGRMPDRLCKAIVEALDAAAAHMGVGR